MRALQLLLLALGCCACAAGRRQTTAELLEQPGVVLFLGDSITWAGGYVEDFEACWRAANPASRAEFLQLGLPSETVSGLSEPDHAQGKFPRPVLSERLVRTLARLRPRIVFACYGMNDGIYLPFDEERFTKFRAGIEDLEQRCRESGARLVLLTPPIYDAQPGEYDDVLARYSSWLVTRQSVAVVDVHTALRDFSRSLRASQPGFMLTSDGVHPRGLGHWLMARELLARCGVAGARTAGSAERFLERMRAGPELLQLVRKRQELLRDAWLTAIGNERPGLPAGLPLAEAETRAAVLEESIRAQLPR